MVKTILNIIFAALATAALTLTAATASPSKATRFFHSGDGHIRLASEKNKKTFDGIYRSESGRYDKKAHQLISAVFDAAGPLYDSAISLRLIEFLDYLEDQLGPGALITITSGFRPPEYNANLRKRGALAAKASLHQYGMAADFFMEGVPSRRVWDHVRALGFGGTGYYQGKTVHVDVGPARFWDEKSSGVGTGLSDDNKLIGLVTDYDYFRSGQMVTLRFIRMTAFPIQVDPEFELIPLQQANNNQKTTIFRPEFGTAPSKGCAEFTAIGQMASFRWVLPSDLPPGRYRIRAGFCGRIWEKMPAHVSTPEFEVHSP